MGEAGAGRPGGVRGVDSGRIFAACEIRGAQGARDARQMRK